MKIITWEHKICLLLGKKWAFLSLSQPCIKNVSTKNMVLTCVSQEN